MKIETQFGTWMPLEDVKSLKGQSVMSREDLVKLAREEGAEVEDEAQIAVCISEDDNEVTYAISDFGGFVFWQDGLFFVPANWEELSQYAAEALKK